MILISACLIGANCRYNATSSLIEELKTLVDKKLAIPICPETLGGLPIPRTPCEIQVINNSIKVVTKDGSDYTSEFLLGANKALEIAEKHNITTAILKSKSPSCGSGKIYDGTFTRTLIDGDGITTKFFMENNIRVFDENNYVLSDII